MYDTAVRVSNNVLIKRTKEHIWSSPRFTIPRAESNRAPTKDTMCTLTGTHYKLCGHYTIPKLIRCSIAAWKATTANCASPPRSFVDADICCSRECCNHAIGSAERNVADKKLWYSMALRVELCWEKTGCGSSSRMYWMLSWRLQLLRRGMMPVLRHMKGREAMSLLSCLRCSKEMAKGVERQHGCCNVKDLEKNAVAVIAASATQSSLNDHWS